METAALAGGHSDTDPPSARLAPVNNTIIPVVVILASALHTYGFIKQNRKKSLRFLLAINIQVYNRYVVCSIIQLKIEFLG